MKINWWHVLLTILWVIGVIIIETVSAIRKLYRFIVGESNES